MAACEEEFRKIPLNDSGDKNGVVGSRHAVSSGEPSSDGSVDEERSALSDSELPDASRIRTIATQAKGPSSDALEAECRAEQKSHFFNNSGDAADESDDTSWNDLVGNGQLSYKILKKGTDVKPRNGQEVSIRVEDKICGVDSCAEVTFILGYSMVIEAWELTVSAMHEGEIVLVKSNSRFAYGSTGDRERNILPNQDMEYEIKLLKIGKAVVFSDMPKPLLSQYVQCLRERGKYYYTRKEFDKAIFVYKRCTDIVEAPRDNEEARNVFSIIHSNLAACYAKLSDWKASLTAASEALKLNERNTKALFRQANAYTNMNMISEAVESLTLALAIDPNDPLIAKELQRAKILQRKSQERERNLYKRMLAGMHLDESPPNRSAIRFRYLISIVVILVVAITFHLFNASVMTFLPSFLQKI